MFTGKNLGLGGSLQENPFQKGQLNCGDVSAIIMNLLPSWAQYMRTPKLEVALMSEWEEKIERIAQVISKQNIISILGVPTWMVLVLERVLDIEKKEHILDVWKGFEVFFHGAVAFGPYRALFRKIIGKKEVHYVEIYNASEGFFAIQDRDVQDEMMLMLDYGIFYEFYSHIGLSQRKMGSYTTE